MFNIPLKKETISNFAHSKSAENPTQNLNDSRCADSISMVGEVTPYRDSAARLFRRRG